MDYLAYYSTNFIRECTLEKVAQKVKDQDNKAKEVCLVVEKVDLEIYLIWENPMYRYTVLIKK